MLKGVIAILADGVLPSSQSVIDSLLDVLQYFAQSGLELLDTKLHIPIISGILNAIDFPDITFLDLFTWIPAIRYTVVYKIVEGDAPFPDSSEVQALISATNWNDSATLFQSQEISGQAKTNTVSKRAALPETLKTIVFIPSHSSASFMMFMGDFLNVFEAEAPIGDNLFLYRISRVMNSRRSSRRWG
ncbi:hypothetical protein BDV12DRAFT_170923 [Aspergillus spectabilis]